MKLTIKQDDLAAALAKGGAAAMKNSPIPILNHVRLVAGVGTLTVASCDLNRFASADAPAIVSPYGETTVPAAALAALAARYPAGADISMELDGPALIVKCGRSRVKLPTLPVVDFPHWADDKADATFSLTGETLATAFGRVRKSCGENHLAGVCVHPAADGLRFVASNRHIIALATLPMPEGGEACPEIIVPAEVVDAATRLFKTAEAVEITASAHKVVFSADGARLAAKLIVGPYIAYRKVIESLAGGASLRLDRRVLSECVERAALSMDPEGVNSGLVAIPRGDALELRGRGSSGREGNEFVPIDGGDGFEPFGFNVGYMNAVLAGFTTETLTLERTPKAQPVVLHADDETEYMAVLSPQLISAQMVA